MWPQVLPKPSQKCVPRIIWGYSIINKTKHRQPNKKEIEKIIYSGCKKYSDGCNTLSLQGGEWSTTLIACSYFQEPRCLVKPGQ